MTTSDPNIAKHWWAAEANKSCDQGGAVLLNLQDYHWNRIERSRDAILCGTWPRLQDYKKGVKLIRQWRFRICFLKPFMAYGPKLFQIVLAGPASKSLICPTEINITLNRSSEIIGGLLQNDQQEEPRPTQSKICKKMNFICLAIVWWFWSF